MVVVKSGYIYDVFESRFNIIFDSSKVSCEKKNKNDFSEWFWVNGDWIRNR